MFAKTKEYIEDSYNELVNKVTWPAWSELQSSAILVAISMGIIALIVFVMDFFVGIKPDNSLWKGLLGFFYSLFS